MQAFIVMHIDTHTYIHLHSEYAPLLLIKSGRELERALTAAQLYEALSQSRSL